MNKKYYQIKAIITKVNQFFQNVYLFFFLQKLRSSTSSFGSHLIIFFTSERGNSRKGIFKWQRGSGKIMVVVTVVGFQKNVKLSECGGEI